MPSTSSYPLVQKQPFTDFFKTGVLKISQISQENTFVGVSLQQSCRPEGLQLYYREAATQVFSCEYCKIFKNNFFIEHLRWLLLLVWKSHLIKSHLSSHRLKVSPQSLKVSPQSLTSQVIDWKSHLHYQFATAVSYIYLFFYKQPV